MSMKFKNQLERFDPVGTGLNRFYPVFLYEKRREKGLFSSNLVGVNRFSRDLNDFNKYEVQEPVGT
ncbi:hypothetical protein ACJMK2_005325, partial [Sinanodonta woodiana]